MTKRLIRLLILFLICVILSSVSNVIFAAELNIEDIKKGDKLETTKTKNIYQYVARGMKEGNTLFKFEKKGSIPKGTTIVWGQILEDAKDTTGSGMGFMYERDKNPNTGEEYIYVQVTYSSIEDRNSSSGVIIFNGKDGVGLKKKTVSDDDQKEADDFNKKYGSLTAEDFDKMSVEEIREIRDEATRIAEKTGDETTLKIKRQATDALKRDDSIETGDTVYQNPMMTSDNNNAEESLDDVISDADDFINTGDDDVLQSNSLENFSKTMYNILLAIGIAVAVIVGGIIGIKLMSAGIEEKADAKKLLVPYFVGCIVVFGAFGIWKLVVTILSSV